MKGIESIIKYSKSSEGIKDLYLEERRREIIKLVNQKRRVAVTELSQQLGVSEVTIRNDLQALETGNLLVRTHGGAVANSGGFFELSLALRRQRQVEEKNQIGKFAAEMVSDGDAIILDSSSTCLAIAQNLKDHRLLTIITNSLIVSQEMLDAPGVTVVMPGGRLRRDTASLVGTDSLEMLQEFNIQKGFFGAHGVTAKDGLTDVSLDEAGLKRPLIAMCRQVIAVLDSTKWGRVGLASFASLAQINRIITDAKAPVDIVEQVRSTGTQVVMV
jgi:DeoR/GlpR family transcriptional regulator of sugar metabolism